MMCCVLTEHRPDGTTATRVWAVDHDTAARIALALGDPPVEQLLTAEQAAAADDLAAQALTV